MIMEKISIFIFLLIVVISCGISNADIEKAKKQTDFIMERIAYGDALDYLPKQYFERESTSHLNDILKYQCDFENRKGNFINEFYKKNIGGADELFLIYEYNLECDDIRFIFNYVVSDSLVLKAIKLESIHDDNTMITRSENRLINKMKK
jgi:hypothetical protein